MNAETATGFSKKQITVTVIVVAVIVGVSYYFYNQGKKTTTTANVPIDPNNDVGITQLAGDLYNDMKGLNISHDDELMRKVLTLSNQGLVTLYNTFNEKYQHDSGQTLYQWFENEYYVPFSDEMAMAELIINRFNSLNLK